LSQWPPTIPYTLQEARQCTKGLVRVDEDLERSESKRL
jgi:hypothetical protein